MREGVEPEARELEGRDVCHRGEGQGVIRQSELGCAGQLANYKTSRA